MATGTITQTLPTITQTGVGAFAPESGRNVYVDGDFAVPFLMSETFNGQVLWGDPTDSVLPRQILFYDGTKPANPDVAITTQNLLAKMTHATDGLYESGSFSSDIDISDPSKVTLIAHLDGWQYDHFMNGTVTWFRVLDSDEAPLFDGTVGTSDADLVLNSVALTNQKEIQLTRFDLIAPLHGD